MNRAGWVAMAFVLAGCGGDDLGPGSDGNLLTDLASRIDLATRAGDLQHNALLDLSTTTSNDLAMQQSGPTAFPLVISTDHRSLQDQNGVPFPILGDAGWEAPTNLSLADQGVYLDDRAAHGFNAVLIEAIEHKFTVVTPPKDLAGNLPFTRRLDGNAFTGSPSGMTTNGGTNGQFAPDPYQDITKQAPDFSYPDPNYFATLDGFIDLCAQKGFLVLLFPAYVGYGGGDEGWMSEMVANDAVIGAGGFQGQPFADAGKSRMWNYGAWIADRYRAADNIVWVYGGDYGGYTQPQKTAVDDLMAGAISVKGKSVLRTAHWARRSLASDITFTAGGFDLESVYADASAAQYGRSGYAHQPAAPTFELEDYYEGNNTEPNRRFAWWSWLSEIGGYFFGNETIWRFDNGWNAALSQQGSKDAAQLNQLIRSTDWPHLVPSGLAGSKNLVTAGGGVDNPQSTDYVAAAATSDGKLLIAYVPPDHKGSITIDMSALSGPAKARWLNPVSGMFNDIADQIPNNGTKQFDPPGDNGSGYSDWVLLINKD
jgi:hypothetical protein